MHKENKIMKKQLIGLLAKVTEHKCLEFIQIHPVTATVSLFPFTVEFIVLRWWVHHVKNWKRWGMHNAVILNFYTNITKT